MEIASVRFRHFKGLRDHRVSLKRMNVLVGPNNAGKSSVLDAFRLLGAAVRHAKRRNPSNVIVDARPVFGWEVPPTTLPIPLVNAHSDSDEDTAAGTSISFGMRDGGVLELLIRDGARCLLTVDVAGPRVSSAKAFRDRYPIEVLHFPTLGPLEEDEEMLQDEYVERNRSGRRSNRMFRNVWIRQPELFPRFKELVEGSWPGVTIKPAEIYGFAPARLEMFYGEKRRDREVSWAGYGFQVWLQLLTHLLAAEGATTLVVDEPEIYLHPDLQRRFFELLRHSDRQVVLATHSAEIVNDAERDEVVLVDRNRRAARRIGDIEGLQEALFTIGSAQNIHLTKLSRGRRVLFLEGQDMRLLRRFAARFGFPALADGGDLTVVPIGGFAQRQKIEDAAWTFGQVLKAEIAIAALLDRDYRSDEEIASIEEGMRGSVPHFHVLGVKEIENYLLVPEAIAAAIASRLRERRVEHLELSENPRGFASDLLERVTDGMRGDVQSQLAAHRIRHLGRTGRDTATLAKEAFDAFEPVWADLPRRLRIVPGKQALSELNALLGREFAVSITAAQVISHLRPDHLPDDLRAVLADLDRFAST